MMWKILSNKRIFLRLVQGLFLFNIADALLSIQLISNEGALEEANPIWEPLLSSNPLLFFSIKITVAGMACFTLWKYNDRPVAQVGALVCFVTYFILLCCFSVFLFYQHSLPV